jgi:hypothetical protein
MAATLYGEHNAIRTPFQLHSRSSDQDLRVALKLAKQQQSLLRSGRTTRRNADIKDEIYPTPRQNVSGARRRHHPSPDPIPHQHVQDDDINRLDRRYSFSSADRKQEALLAPASRVDISPSALYGAITVPNAVNPPSQQYKSFPTDKSRQNMSAKEQRKAEKRSRKELEEKVKEARKMVKTDIKDKAKKSRKRLKATYKAASSNPEAFVAWAEAYQRLRAVPDEGTSMDSEPTDEPPKPSSIQWLKSLLPKRLAGGKKPPEVPAYLLHTPRFELPGDQQQRAELAADESVRVRNPDPPENQAAASSKAKARTAEVANGESSELVPWTLQTSGAIAPPSNARIRHLHDFSLLDCSPSESSSQVQTTPMSISETPISEAETTQTIKQYLAREKGYLRDEIGRLGVQTAAKLRQCATEMEQAERSRNADLERTLSEQHRRHAQELEKFTAALNALQDQGKRSLKILLPDGHEEHEASRQVLKTKELSVTRRKHDVTSQLQEASLREKEVVAREREAALREREAASREREAASRECEAASRECEAASRERETASREREAISLATEASSQGRFLLPEEQPPPLQKQGTPPPMQETSTREPDAGLQMKGLPQRLSKIRTVGMTKDASKKAKGPLTSQLANLSLHDAADTLEPLVPGSGVDTGNSFDHEELRALSQSARTFVDQLIAELLSLQGAGFRSHAVPKRKSASSATFVKATGQPRPRSGPSARRAVNKGKGKELSEDEGDSDEEPRKRRRPNLPVRDSQQRILACPYSKYDICRYSELNVTEKGYRGCTSCFLTDISRLK